MSTKARRAGLGLLAAALVTTALPATAYAAPPTTPYVSEIHYDNAGTDTGEFVEVHLPAGTSSTGLSIVLYNGSGGATYGSVAALPEVTAPADAPAVAVVEYAGTLQNGAPDGVALVGPDGVLEFLSYEGTFTATDGPAAGTASTDIGVSESGSDPVGESLSRVYDPVIDGLVWQASDIASKGAVNPAPAPPDPSGACDVAPTHDIGQVQGTGASTPLAGQAVTIRGIVVGDLPGLGGFHLADADGDGDAATSDGIFVASSVAVDLGDEVAATGSAGENFGETRVTADGDAEVCAEGTADDLPDPAPLDLPAGDAERERLEGMLVEPVDVLTVSEVFDLTSFGELTLSEGGVLVQPTELARPGAEAEAIAAANQRRRITLDDGLSARVTVATRPYLSRDTPVRVGDEVDFTEPLVLGYGFSAWRLQPADGTADGVFAPQNTRPPAPEPVGGDLQVAAFNVLNYFLTWTGDNARGAQSEEEFGRQSAKIVAAIARLDAEVVTLLEIEDTDSTGFTPGNADAALADLVDRLNEAAGARRWAYVPLPDELYAVDRDVIRNGIIYRRDVVSPVGDPVGLVDEEVWDNAREPIAQTFTADGDAVTVVANHFKSKSVGDPAPVPGSDNEDTGDGQGAWNGDRVRQAASLAAFADQVVARAGDPDILLLGDLNAYTEEDPIERLRRAGFVDLGQRLDPGRYSYVFDEQSGSLDHALTRGAMVAKVTDLTHWNINAVESFAYQYNGDPALYAPDPYRSSDHDPLILGIDLSERCAGRRPTIVGTPGRDVLRGTGGPDVIMGLGGADVISGGNGADVICGGAGADVLDGGNGDDQVLGGFGADELYGGNGSDTLVGGSGNDRLDQERGRGVEIPGGPNS